jgi:hypothetical protein
MKLCNSIGCILYHLGLARKVYPQKQNKINGKQTWYYETRKVKK